VACGDASGHPAHNGSVDENRPDWYLQEWMAHFGKRQASLTNELGWTKGRANYVWHSRAPYHRELVNEISAWLGVQPFELLMAPREALALRRLRETAALIVAEGVGGEHPTDPSAPPPIRQRKAG
jgi:hypothetical protein